MALSLDVFNKITPGQRGLILLGFVALIGVGYYFGIYAGKKAELVTVQKELDTNKKKLEELNNVKSKYAEVEKKVAELEAELQILLGAIPTDAEIYDVLEKVSIEGKKAGLEFVLFQPGKERTVEDKNYLEIPVTINVTGNYHSFGVFLDKVRQLERIINIRNITMKKKSIEGGNVILNITCSAVTFKFIEEKKVKEVEKAKKEEKKKDTGKEK